EVGDAREVAPLFAEGARDLMQREIVPPIAAALAQLPPAVHGKKDSEIRRGISGIRTRGRSFDLCEVFDSEAEIADVAADATGFGRATERHGADVGQVGTVAEPVADRVFGLDVRLAAVLDFILH